jgi:hypothetical protein
LGPIKVRYVLRPAAPLGQTVRDHAPLASAAECPPRAISGQSVVALGLREPRASSNAGRRALRARRKPAFQRR